MLSYIANTSRMHTRTHTRTRAHACAPTRARTHARTRTHTAVAVVRRTGYRYSVSPNRDGPLRPLATMPIAGYSNNHTHWPSIYPDILDVFRV